MGCYKHTWLSQAPTTAVLEAERSTREARIHLQTVTVKVIQEPRNGAPELSLQLPASRTSDSPGVAHQTWHLADR